MSSDHHQASASAAAPSADNAKTAEKIAQRPSRKPCFSDEEIRVLRDKIEANKRVLCDGKNNNFNEKGRIWSSILESVNFVCYRENGCLRTIKEIKSKWKRLRVIDGKAAVDNMSDIQLLISQCTSDSLAREELELATESSPLMNHVTEPAVTVANGHAENPQKSTVNVKSSTPTNDASATIRNLLKNGLPANTTTTTTNNTEVKQETPIEFDSDNDDEADDFQINTKNSSKTARVNVDKPKVLLSPVKQKQQQQQQQLLLSNNTNGSVATSPRKCKFDDYVSMIRDLTAEDYFGKTVAFMLKEIHNPKRKRVMQAQIMTILAQD